jgi:hypothetical protein
MHQGGADTRYLVCADRSADPAAADGYAALDFTGHHRACKRDDEVRIIIIGIKAMRPEIDQLMPRFAEAGNQLFLQAKPAMIGCDSDAHVSLQ